MFKRCELPLNVFLFALNFKTKMGKEARGDWNLIEKGVNHLFATYYKANNIIPLSEWENFTTHLNTPLPTNFRFTGSKKSSNLLQQKMIDEYFNLPSNVDGVDVSLPFQLPWYPNGLGWQYNAARSIIRHNAEMSRFHGFLVQETEAGNISRQGNF